MKNFFIFFSLLFFFCSSLKADLKEMKNMFQKGASYNLGISREDTTIKGIKFKPHTNISAFNYSVKKGYGWTNYGIKVVSKKDNFPVRYGETALRFELRHEDCGFLFKNGKERDCTRSKAHHRVEVGQDEERAFKHKQNFWYSFSYLVPKNFKFYRKQSVFQFHSTEGPYNPPFQIEVMPKHGLTVKISTYEDVLPTTEGDCGGSIKVKVNYCENILLEYIVLSADDLDKLTGTWIDFVIHSVWDKRPSDDNKNKGLHELFINGTKKLHYEGQTMWRKGKTVTQFGIYGSKEIRPFLGSMPSHSKARSIPRIAFYDEIWAKKECEKLKLERLGYSCKDLRDQEDIITKPDFAEKPG